MEDIQKSFDEDKLLDTDVVWKVGLKNWIPLTKVILKKPSVQENPSEIDFQPPPLPEKSKKGSNLPLKILAFIPIVILFGGFYFLYPRNIGPKLPFSQLDNKSFQKIGQILKAGKPVRELILSKDAREIWFATSLSGTFSAQLNLKSIQGSILGNREVILNSKSELSNNWARFYTYDLERGTKIIPGYYAYTLRLIPRESKEGFNYVISKIAPFLKDPKTDEIFTGKILFSPDSKEDFQKKLDEYKSKAKAAAEKPLKEKMEKWEAYLSIVNKVEILLLDKVKILNKGSAIVSFEKEYTEFLGPMLSQIVIEAKNQSKELAANSQEKSLEYEKLFIFGKDIGETTSEIVGEIKKIKKFGEGERAIFSKKISDSYATLRKNIETEIPKIQNEIDLISF